MIRSLLKCGSLLVISGTAVCASFLENIRSVPLTPAEKATVEDRSGKLTQLPLKFTPFDAQRAQIPFRREILADRRTFLADDPMGQVLVYCLTPLPGNPAAGEVRLELKSGGKTLETQTLVAEHKFAALLPLKKLKPGEYEITGRFQAGGREWALRPAQFTVAAGRRNSLPIPEAGISMILQLAPIQGSQVSPIITGIPIARHQAAGPDEFTLLENGEPVTAQFTQRATWYPGQQSKWLGLSFLARYENGKPAEYRVVRRKTAPAATPLIVAETEQAIRVQTGAIEFEVGRKPFAGIRSVKLAV